MNVRLIHGDSALQDDSKKTNMIQTLRGLLRDSFRLKNEGAISTKFSHRQGYVDGYMRILVDAGFVTQRELLDIVAEVRRGVDGPATKTMNLGAEPVRDGSARAS